MAGQGWGPKQGSRGQDAHNQCLRHVGGAEPARGHGSGGESWVRAGGGLEMAPCWAGQGRFCPFAKISPGAELEVLSLGTRTFVSPQSSSSSRLWALHMPGFYLGCLLLQAACSGWGRGGVRRWARQPRVRALRYSLPSSSSCPLTPAQPPHGVAMRAAYLFLLFLPGEWLLAMGPPCCR